MNLKDLYNKIKHNHMLMMALCCGIPLILLYIAVYFFGIRRSYLYWFIILLCPLMHLWMMKDMHKKHSENGNKKKQKQDGGCH